ncbi:MAG: hypothetical protein AB7W47_09525 [Calditrichaceae bacterium]
MQEQENKQSLYEFIPILTFVISFFIFEIFDWMVATKFILAVMLSLVAFIIMMLELKQEKRIKPIQAGKLHFYTGLLSFIAILIFFSGFLHWYKMISNFSRTGILLGLVLVYFILLFRSMRFLSFYNRTLESKDK